MYSLANSGPIDLTSSNSEIYISWSSGAGQSADVLYHLDLNGDGVVNGSDVTVNIDQTLYADQATAAPTPDWSGYFSLGTAQLSANSVLRAQSVANATWTIDGIRVVIPEPASFALLGLGSLLVMSRRHSA